MDKTLKIIELVEHPERFSEAEMAELLSDDKALEMYLTVCDVEAVYARQSTGEAVEARKPKARRISLWRVASAAAACVAAIVVGLLMMRMPHTEEHLQGKTRGNGTRVGEMRKHKAGADERVAEVKQGEADEAKPVETAPAKGQVVKAKPRGIAAAKAEGDAETTAAAGLVAAAEAAYEPEIVADEPHAQYTSSKPVRLPMQTADSAVEAVMIECERAILDGEFLERERARRARIISL